MAISGNPRSFHKKFKFLVDIDGFINLGFQKSSELSVEIAKVEYREGGALIPNKSPGLVTFTDITLERGATDDLEMYTWLKEVVDVAAGGGLVDNDYKRDVDFIQIDRDGTELRRWPVKGAWPIKFTAGEWDNDADEVTINMLTITYDSFEDPL